MVAGHEQGSERVSIPGGIVVMVIRPIVAGPTGFPGLSRLILSIIFFLMFLSQPTGLWQLCIPAMIQGVPLTLPL